MKRNVLVLLSTFNGQKYFNDQINSILNQEKVEIHIRIRDDGSSEEFQKYLASYESYKNLKITYGNNIGIARSYWRLLNSIRDLESYDAIAFADQDDIWLSNKMIHGLKILDSNQPSPMLYSSGYKYIDSSSKLIGSFKPKNSFLKPQNFYVQNICLGATQVFNRAAVQILQNFPPPRLLMHDAWAGLIISYLGSVYLDGEETIHYRLHDSNAIGRKSRVCAAREFRKNVFRHLKELDHFRELISSEYFVYSNQEFEREINQFFNRIQAKSLSKRICVLFDLKPYRRTFFQRTIFFLIILFFGFKKV